MGFKIVCDCGCDRIYTVGFSNAWTYGEKWVCPECKQEKKYFECEKEP